MVVFGMALVVMVVVAALGPWVVGVCRQRGLVAAVTSRSSHRVPTPHGGGFVLPLVVVPVALGLVMWEGGTSAVFLKVLLLASLLVAFIGWRDDHAELDPQLRLAVHLPAVGLALAFLPPVFDVLPQQWVVPWWVEKVVLLLAWGWFVNLYNFMDGADGLASTEAVFIALGVALCVPALAPVAVVVAAAAAGLLRVNGPKARVFLGDVGSTWLGYVLGGLLLLGCAENTWQIVWPLAVLPLVFCFDATTTLVRRMAEGHRPWVPHKTFWFHRFLGLGYSHGQLVAAVAGLNVALFGVAWVAWQQGWPEVGFGIGLLAMVVIVCYIRAIERGIHHGKSKR